MSFIKGLLKYSGLLMLSGWMFFMGVIVGRGTAPVEFDTGWFQERLAVIFEEADITQQEVVKEEKPELDFYAALQKSDLKEDYDIKIKSPSDSKSAKDAKILSSSEVISLDVASGDLQAPLKKSRKSMSKAGSKAEGAKQQIEQVASASSDVESALKSDLISYNQVAPQLPEAQSEPVKAYADTLYSYTIQIASFNSEADADTHIAKLSEKGHSAYKSSGLVGDKTWYRIRIGNFNNITEAKESLKKLEAGGINGLIIQKE
ncbi:MAG: SPOR domain-containing protein [Desulfamplus sp.]|nr:SPOR domain-containing protein [Desulfamplus sp.]